MTLAINHKLGPQLVIKTNENFTLSVGTRSSSLFNGSDSSSVTISDFKTQIQASEVLGAYRAVTLSGYLCDQTLEGLSKYAGVTSVAMNIGDTGYITKHGLIYEAGWTWTPDLPIFIGPNGILTQTVSSNPIRRIGFAISVNQINLDPYPIIGA